MPRPPPIIVKAEPITSDGLYVEHTQPIYIETPDMQRPGNIQNIRYDNINDRYFIIEETRENEYCPLEAICLCLCCCLCD